jgi:hypothetical protein
MFYESDMFAYVLLVNYFSANSKDWFRF